MLVALFNFTLNFLFCTNMHNTKTKITRDFRLLLRTSSPGVATTSLISIRIKITKGNYN